MKKFLIILLLAIYSISAKAQDIYDKCMNEIQPILKDADTVWIGDNYINGYTQERQARYCRFYIQASNIVEKYVQNATNIDDKADLLWLQSDLLSEFLWNDDGQDYNGLSSTEYNEQVNKYMSIQKKLLEYNNIIPNSDERELDQAHIAKNYGYIYFAQHNYNKAKEQFNIVISKYNTLLNSSLDTNLIKELGQIGYYNLGYVEYRVGNINLSNTYYNKAKSILNDDYIVPYEEL